MSKMLTYNETDGVIKKIIAIIII